MFPPNWTFLRLSRFGKIGSTGRTERQTHGLQRLMRLPTLESVVWLRTITAQYFQRLVVDSILY